jgi:hypothetical protein
MTELIEYRVRPANRYIVTRYQTDTKGSALQTLGEFNNYDQAYGAAYALCKVEHDRLGWPPGDERIQYPRFQPASRRKNR